MIGLNPRIVNPDWSHDHAQKLTNHHWSIGKYERNEAMPGSGVLIALADALHTTVDYLVGAPDLVLEDLEFRKKRVHEQARRGAARGHGAGVS